MMTKATACDWCSRPALHALGKEKERKKNLDIYRLFGLRNELVHHLLTPNFFVWFVEWNELIHYHLIPHS
jgi:hypothetical protein